MLLSNSLHDFLVSFTPTILRSVTFLCPFYLQFNDHSRTCAKSKSACPFSEVGCKFVVCMLIKYDAFVELFFSFKPVSKKY